MYLELGFSPRAERRGPSSAVAALLYGLVLLVIFQLVSAGFGLFLSHIILFNQPKSAEILPAEQVLCRTGHNVALFLPSFSVIDKE
jgi:hypothetical protein